MTPTSDRGLAAAIATGFAFGLGLLAFGLWGIGHLDDPPGPAGSRLNPVYPSLVAGLLFLGFATYELVHRLRRGPQEPGRHSRLGD